jgi:hypothetical protein
VGCRNYILFFFEAVNQKVKDTVQMSHFKPRKPL